MNSKAVTYEALQPEEVQKLPQRVRAQFSEADATSDEWLVVCATWPFHLLVEGLNRLGEKRKNVASLPNASHVLDVLTSWLVSEEQGLSAEIIYDNAVARTTYLEETSLLTADEIHDMSGLSSKNRSEPASRWRKERKTFGVRSGQRYMYPDFQFYEGRPREVVGEILAALPNEMTNWQKAFWFASGNGWLDGDEPHQRLDDPTSVVEAARQLSNLAHG